MRFLARGFHVSGDHLGQESKGYRFPYGPVALITPFNFPLEIPALQLMGALFMGNRPILHVDHKYGGTGFLSVSVCVCEEKGVDGCDWCVVGLYSRNGTLPCITTSTMHTGCLQVLLVLSLLLLIPPQ